MNTQKSLSPIFELSLLVKLAEAVVLSPSLHEQSEAHSNSTRKIAIIFASIQKLKGEVLTVDVVKIRSEDESFTIKLYKHTR